MPRKEMPSMTFQLTEEERDRLEKYCEHQQRNKGEILREFIRNLKIQK